MQVNTPELLAELTLVIGSTGPLHSAMLALFTNVAPAFGKTFALSDITLATFAGYTPSTAITWGTPTINPAGQAEVVGTPVTFSATGPTPANTITGAAILDSTGALVRVVDVFPVPVTINATSEGFNYIPRYSVGSGN